MDIGDDKTEQETTFEMDEAGLVKVAVEIDKYKEETTGTTGVDGEENGNELVIFSPVLDSDSKVEGESTVLETRRGTVGSRDSETFSVTEITIGWRTEE